MMKETEAWQQEMDKLFQEAVHAVQTSAAALYEAYVADRYGAAERKSESLTVAWQSLAHVEWCFQQMFSHLQNVFAPPYITYLPSEDFMGPPPKPKRITQKFGEPVGPPSEDDVP